VPAYRTGCSCTIANLPFPSCDSLQVKNHVDLMEALDLVDFESAAEVSGSKFYYLRNAAALLELALVNYTMQVGPTLTIVLGNL
jgi:seryl-tRNA synthetase